MFFVLSQEYLLSYIQIANQWRTQDFHDGAPTPNFSKNWKLGQGPVSLPSSPVQMDLQTILIVKYKIEFPLFRFNKCPHLALNFCYFTRRLEYFSEKLHG